MPRLRSRSAATTPRGGRGGLLTFVQSIASFNGDLSSLTAPPFILGTTSLTEFSSYWAEHPAVLVAPAAEPDPARRALLVLKWFLTTLKSQYCSRSDKLGSEKKPLNPFLGELFLGRWEDEAAGTTELVSEQVSHHPPVTAYCIWNDKHGVRLQGYNGQKASFSRTIHVRQVGHALYTLGAPHNETYLITLPSIHIEGLIYGSPFVELNKSTTITSSSGFVAKIDYTGKGWVSGKKNSFHATLHPTGREKEVLYSVEGQWNESFTIREHDPKTHKPAAALETWAADQHAPAKLLTPPLAEQDPRESNRAWKEVADAILKGDMDATSHHKSKIENSQREMRKKEQAEGTEWQRTFFSKIPDGKTDEVWDKLAAVTGERAETDKTGPGCWRWDEDKWSRMKTRPFPGGV